MDSASSASSSSFVSDGYQRGDYITFSGMSSYSEVTSGLARGRDESGKRRVVSVKAQDLTVRPVSPRGLEWLRARLEDWILWPLSDLRSRFRSHLR